MASSTQFVPPSLPSCSRFSSNDAASTSTAYSPTSAKYWTSLASSRGLPGAVVAAVIIGGGAMAIVITAVAAAAASARARRQRARLERRRRRSSSTSSSTMGRWDTAEGGKSKREGQAFEIHACAATSSPLPETTTATSTSFCSSLLSVLVLLLCASVVSLSSWGIFSAASALKNQPRHSWGAASKAADAARAALVPGDAAVTLARQAQSGLLSLAESLPAIVSAAVGGSGTPSTNASAALLASLGVDLGGLQQEATTAAAAAGEVADRGGDAAAAVRSVLNDGFEKIKREYEARSEHASTAAKAGVLGLTLGLLVAASVFLGGASLSSSLGLKVCFCCCRRPKKKTKTNSSSTRLLVAAAALSFLASSLAVAAGLAGGAVAAEASRDACLFGETAAAREIVRETSSPSSSSSTSRRNDDLASKIALFYLDGGKSSSTNGGKSESVFSLFGITPELEQLLLSSDSENGTSSLGGAALAFLQTDTGRSLVARAGLPARERRSILNLPDTVASLRATAKEFERAAAPAVVSRPALLQLKELPCCALPRASAPWAAASTAGGFALAAAASLACFAAVVGAGKVGEEEEEISAAPVAVVPSPLSLAVLREEGEEEEGESEGQQRVRGFLSWWSRRRRDGFFRSRDAAAARGGEETGTGNGEVEVSPRPWPTL